MGNTHPRCTHAANFSTSQGQKFLIIFIIHMLFKNVMDIAITHVRLTVMLSPPPCPHFLSIVGVLCTGPKAIEIVGFLDGAVDCVILFYYPHSF